MAVKLQFNLDEINNIVPSGFIWEISSDIIQTINYLCSEISVPPITSNIFEKKEQNNIFINDNKYKKRKGNKGMEVSESEWESLRTFQATKIEHKDGVAADIDSIRYLLNKLTDKTFLDIREKILDKINLLISHEGFTEEDGNKISNTLYDIASGHKFYSKIFADLYAELVTNYNWLRPVFTDKYNNLYEEYNNIQYVDPEVDYDKFCDNNKQNEKRRSITTFYLNLCKNGFIEKKFIIKLLIKLIDMVYDNIEVKNKKNEIDEITENIAILYDKEFIDEFLENESQDEEYNVNYTDESISESIENLAKMKAKDYPSLSNKAIFKYMDLVEM